MLRHALDNYYKFCAYVSAFSLCLICLIVSLQVVFNIINKLWEVFFGHSLGMLLPSYDSITGYLLVATTFFAVAYTFRQGAHIRVNLILTKIESKKLVKYIEIFSVSLVLALMIYASIYSVMLVHETWQFKDVSSGIIPIPIWIPQLVMSLGCITFVIALLDSLVGVITNEHLLDGGHDV
jgi:TRAP-type C4-dicarboxylate transport system permease small subunit